MLYYFKRKYRQIRNIIKWIPILWNQFDFDYRYALNVFTFKLEQIADFMESDKACTMSAEHRASRIRMVLRLMKKVYDEDYGCEYQDQIERLYGPRYWIFDPQFEHMFEFPYTTEKLEEIKKVEHELFMKSNAKQQRAHKLLWKLVEHNIRGWWD